MGVFRMEVNGDVKKSGLICLVFDSEFWETRTCRADKETRKLFATVKCKPEYALGLV